MPSVCRCACSDSGEVMRACAQQKNGSECAAAYRKRGEGGGGSRGSQVRSAASTGAWYTAMRLQRARPEMLVRTAGEMRKQAVRQRGARREEAWRQAGRRGRYAVAAPQRCRQRHNVSPAGVAMLRLRTCPRYDSLPQTRAALTRNTRTRNAHVVRHANPRLRNAATQPAAVVYYYAYANMAYCLYAVHAARTIRRLPAACAAANMSEMLNVFACSVWSPKPIEMIGVEDEGET